MPKSRFHNGRPQTSGFTLWINTSGALSLPPAAEIIVPTAGWSDCLNHAMLDSVVSVLVQCYCVTMSNVIGNGCKLAEASVRVHLSIHGLTGWSFKMNTDHFSLMFVPFHLF